MLAPDRLAAVEDQVEGLHEGQTLSFGLRLEEDLNTLFGTARLIVNAYRECKQVQSTELDAHLETVAASTRITTAHAIYEALQKMTEILRKEVRVERHGSKSDEIALRFLEFAGRPAVGVECQLRARASGQPSGLTG